MRLGQKGFGEEVWGFGYWSFLYGSFSLMLCNKASFFNCWMELGISSVSEYNGRKCVILSFSPKFNDNKKEI